jgi:hypothetical protein
MAIERSFVNQIIEAPLVMYTGSITAHTVPSGPVQGPNMIMLNTSLPTYGATPWQYKINPKVVTTVSTTQVVIQDLQLTLQNSIKYLIYGYILVGSTINTTGVRIGATAANFTTAIYDIEVPSSTTATVLGINATASPTTSPASDIANYYYVSIRAIVVAAATGTPTVAPTFSTSNAANSVSIGPGSILYYRYY